MKQISKMFHRSLHFLSLAILALFLHFGANGQVLTKKPIRITSGDFYTEKNAEIWLNSFLKSNNRQTTQILVQFEAIPNLQDRIRLEQGGIKLLSYIPENAFIALVYANVDVTTIRKYKLNSIVDINPVWKIGFNVDKLNAASVDMEVKVAFWGGVANAEKAIVNYGGRVVKDNLKLLGIYDVAIPSNSIKALASFYGVEYIDVVRESLPLDIETINTQKVNNAKSPTVFGGYGLTGKGVTIGVGDNTSGNFHVDLKDRIINYNPMKYADHGIHTSGIAGGAGIMDPEAEGVAPATNIISQYYSAIWEETPSLYDAHGMTITNNSYAAAIGNCKVAGTYDINSQAIDKYALQYPNVLHVFAGGNDGILTCAPFPEGYATVSGAYQPAKNNLVVSSIDRYYLNREVTSSSGPVKDGRLKPEMSAVGANVYSADKEDEYFTTLGTSQASPQVVGALALLTERFKQLNSNVSPAGDVMKAIILNGATDVGFVGPDFTNGFGTLNLHRSLKIVDSAWYTKNSILPNGQKTLNITVPPNTAQLKVLLTWHDVAASPMASKVLVNDLDLEVSVPGGQIEYPLVLDPAPANVKNLATEMPDHLNNTEQIVVEKPIPGSYDIIVKGFNIPSGTQDYVIAYDLVPTGIELTYPVAGSRINGNDSVFIYWEASVDINNFTLEYSTDNGSNWNNIDNNIPAAQQWYVWKIPPGISSGECKMRLKRNNTGEVHTSGSFAITSQQILQLDALQCPGYIRINWTSVPNASGYEMLIKSGAKMISIDTVMGNSYAFSGLSLDSLYYVAIRPIINGMGGYRSIAVKRKPVDGSCTGAISDGDLMIQKILSPTSGRKFTSTALTNKEPLTIVVRNLDDAPCNSYKVSYRINNGAWVSKTVLNSLQALEVVSLTVDELDLSALKTYIIHVAIENTNLTDPVQRNDSLYAIVKSLDNNPIPLTNSFVADFENLNAFMLIKDSLGISPDEHWDYENSTDTGQLRSFANNSITLKGNRSISLDALKNMPSGNQNTLTGTFNLESFNSSNEELRFEFTYLVHGIPQTKDSNEVWVRGKDDNTWVKIYNYNTDVTKIGIVQNSGSLSLTDAFLNNQQDFTSSTQIKFNQKDTSVISLRNYGNGVTFDDVTIYRVFNDVQLLSIESPANLVCGLFGEIPLQIKLRNGVGVQQNNVQLNYQLDDGAVVTETLNMIGAKETIQYSFSKKMDFNKQGLRKIRIWLSAPGDSYPKNDSILNYEVHNEPLITTFPYSEDFEKNDGYWYTGGLNSSWEYGTPNGNIINSAPNITKAWVTNLDGNYNNLEHSYLFSPCFDVSTLLQPVFKVSNRIDIENCGSILCDAAYVEYSPDGIEWKKLGVGNEGFNWYNDTTFDVWTHEDRGYWQNAFTKTPVGMSSLRFRFVLNTDAALNMEGIGVDNIEVYDYYQAPKLIGVFPNPVNNAFTIRWNATEGTQMRIRLIDFMGREVYKTETSAITNIYNETIVRPPKLAAGVYILKCFIGENSFEYKLVFL